MKGYIIDGFIAAGLLAVLVGVALLVAPKAKCGEYDCSGFICVVHADCPETCFCAKEPWAPQGECS